MRILLSLFLTAASFAQQPNGLLTRRYKEGETLTYRMKAVNENWRYEIQASGVVKKDSAGKYFEEFAWSNLMSNGAALTLPPASVQFRQTLSLDPGNPPAIPNLSVVSPMLIGPITDLLTFYVDLWLPIRSGALSRAGDHFYQKRGTPASWADGNYVVLGEDSIDFDVTLTNVDPSAKVATVLVKHVPPDQPQVHLPATWMQKPVADTPNNWVEVAKKDVKYVAAVGKETFDVRLEVSLADGKILSGTIRNPVTAQERDCKDAALSDCGDPRQHDILRTVEISLDR